MAIWTWTCHNLLNLGLYCFDDVDDDFVLHKEGNKSCQQFDNASENSLLTVLRQYAVFSDDRDTGKLQNIATKDIATTEISQSLLNAQHLGQEQLNSFVEERLINNETRMEQPTKFFDCIKKNNPLTFNSLYAVDKSSTDKDKRGIQKLIET